MNNYQSQFCQDLWVDNVLNKKNNGYFIDLGCYEYKNINNSYFLEKERNWKGLAVEIEERFKNEWIENRPNTIFLNEDATKIDYEMVLEKNNFPKEIDYLSIDLEPALISIQALYKIINTNYIFRTISFETDYYNEKSTRDPSREFLKNNGYIFIKDIGWSDGNPVDDLYIHESIYNSTFTDFETIYDMKVLNK